jgi:excisionase family DNA binding protein
MLRVQQVAQRLNASLATVYLLIEKGDLVAVRIGAGGAGVRVLDADLAAFIESRRTSNSPPPQRVQQVQLKHLK